MGTIWIVWCCRCLPQCLCNSRILHERVHVGLWDQIRQYQMLKLTTAKQWLYPPAKIIIIKKTNVKSRYIKCKSVCKFQAYCIPQWWVQQRSAQYLKETGHIPRRERLRSRVTNTLYTDSIGTWHELEGSHNNYIYIYIYTRG